MELPKNITQIGEVNKDCKVYVEDYVISYMKQMNHSAQDKGMTVALYGKRYVEEDVSYYFLYGACRAESLQREVRHLSQAQLQEIEKLRKKCFAELEFVGYRILNGDMIEGMHICEQGICRYIGGYARFYEKNDAMLAYMLEAREQAEPEQVDQTRYEEVKKRQEERRDAASVVNAGQPVEWLKRSASTSVNLQRMRLAAVGGFALLCLLGIGTFRENELAVNEQTLNADVAANAAVEPSVTKKETLQMEDKLEQALFAENQSLEVVEDSRQPEAELTNEESQEREIMQESESVQESQAESASVETPESEEVIEGEMDKENSPEVDSSVEEQTEDVTQTSQKGNSAVAYIIQPGDTLIGICLRQYGSDVRMTDVCLINNISDPDDIKEGQIILLPD